MIIAALVRLVAGAGAVAGAAIGARGRVRIAIAAMLDLWTAAGLLHLAGDRSWGAIGAAAACVAVRKIVAVAMTRHSALA